MTLASSLEVSLVFQNFAEIEKSKRFRSPLFLALQIGEGFFEVRPCLRKVAVTGQQFAQVDQLRCGCTVVADLAVNRDHLLKICDRDGALSEFIGSHSTNPQTSCQLTLVIQAAVD